MRHKIESELNNKIKLPQSATNMIINLSGLIGFCIAIYFLHISGLENNRFLYSSLVLVMIVLPIVILEALFGKNKFIVAIKSRRVNQGGIKRTIIKLIALYFILFLIAVIYWLFPEYNQDGFNNKFYKHYYQAIIFVLPALIFLAVPYIYFVDRYMERPQDIYYNLGSFLLGKVKLDKAKALQLFLGWLVKLFFLPLMYTYLSENLLIIVNNPNFFIQLFKNTGLMITFLYTIDLVYATAGYCLTMRLLDYHIRSAEPTVKGWLVAIVCYQPFWGLLGGTYLAYNSDNFGWNNLFADSTILAIIWGFFIVSSITIYSLSTVAIGLRFSNLTHRGIVTNGPYKYSKHPAYISKNISWWLIAMPFISASDSVVEIIRNCTLLVLVNCIYYIRAKTEEKHLSADPVYQQYQFWIAEYGIFSKLKNCFKIIK